MPRDTHELSPELACRIADSSRTAPGVNGPAVLELLAKKTAVSNVVMIITVWPHILKVVLRKTGL